MKRLIKLWKTNPVGEGGLLCPEVSFRSWIIAILGTTFSVALLLLLLIAILWGGK